MADNLYATDGRCHNAQPGTFGHECGKPATWLAKMPGGFTTGFCDNCRTHGYEARGMEDWRRIAPKLARAAIARAEG